jgi:hypothetical protein
MDHSALPDLSLLASLPSSAQRLYLTMAVVGTQLYFLAGYQVPSGDDSFRTVSLVHSFDTSAAPGLAPAWSSFRPKMSPEDAEDGDKELFIGVKTGGYGRILAHPVSYPNVFKTDSGSDTDS